MKTDIIVLIIAILALLACIFLLMPLTVHAGGFDNVIVDHAPPELDEVQANRWLSTNPLARPYLARMWGIDPRVARAFGAVYEPRSYDASSPTEAPLYSLNDDVYTLIGTARDSTRWPSSVQDVYVKQYTPLDVEYPNHSDYSPNIVEYEAPPGLDRVQQVTWGQSSPWNRARLARLYGISEEIAREYGARYE